ncbi:hypothetical protein [Burkholderia vietnamiensis]|uniref:hypothetical protein n=1 Tax=Burkholderia vietnamiensis TaxID=60552 RepID=UPI00352C2D77
MSRTARRRIDDAGHTQARHADRSNDASSLLSILSVIDSDAFALAGSPVMPSRNVAVAQSASSRCSDNHKYDTFDSHTASPESRILGIRAKLQFESAQSGDPAIAAILFGCRRIELGLHRDATTQRRSPGIGYRRESVAAIHAAM